MCRLPRLDAARHVAHGASFRGAERGRETADLRADRARGRARRGWCQPPGRGSPSRCGGCGGGGSCGAGCCGPCRSRLVAAARGGVVRSGRSRRPTRVGPDDPRAGACEPGAARSPALRRHRPREGGRRGGAACDARARAAGRGGGGRGGGTHARARARDDDARAAAGAGGGGGARDGPGGLAAQAAP